MTMLFTVGLASTYSSGGRRNTIRNDEGAVMTADRVPLPGISSVGWGNPNWTLDGYIEVDRWMKTGGNWSTMALLVGANVELLVLNNAGTLSCKLRVWLEDAAGTATSYDSSTVVFAPGADGNPNHWALMFEQASRRACLWLEGAVKIATGSLGSAGDVLHHRHSYVGAVVNVSGSDLVIDTGATPGLVALDYLRFRRSAAYTYNTGFTAPTPPFGDSASPTAFVWPLRESTLPAYASSTFGDEHGLLRLSSDEPAKWAGVWAITPAGGTTP